MTTEAPTDLPRWLTRPAARFYGWGAARRASKFDAGRGVVTIDRPVLSVGNLSVGGTGKTPVVSWLVRTLREAGHDPAIAMRGYKARTGGSDEALLHAESMEDVPVVAQPDRLSGLIELFATERGRAVDCVVLDDGFQHRRLARAFDLVLIDATRSPLGDALLPEGFLREPLAALSRSTHIALTHAESVGRQAIDTLDQGLERTIGRSSDASLEHAWTGLDVHEPTGAVRREPVGWLKSRAVVAACAIGNPRAFLAAVGRATGQEVAARVFSDHHPLGAGAARELARSLQDRGAHALVVTAKDWTKLSLVQRDRWPCPVVVPRLEIRFGRGEDTLREAALRVVSEHDPDAD